MRLSTGQYVIRAFCGLGLLLLPAVQQKICTWPARSETQSRRPPKPASAPTSGEQPKRKPKRPLTLAALLPDVAPPRWPNHTHLVAIQRVRPLPVTTWMSGPAGIEEESVGAGGVDGLFPKRLPSAPVAQRLALFGDAGIRLVRADRHVFLTTVLKTGPPSA